MNLEPVLSFDEAPGGAAAAGLAARLKAFFAGDSTFVAVGAGSGGTGNVGGSRPFSAPMQAAAYLSAHGVPATVDTIVANNNMTVSADWPLYRTDMSIPATPAIASSSPTAGGTQYRLSSSSHTPITFTPVQAFDTVEFWQPRVSGGGALTISVDGGAANSFSVNNATSDIQRLTLSVAKGMHSLTFDATGGTGGAGAYFPIINAYDSTTPSVQIFNAGARNWLTGDWAANATNTGFNNPLNALRAVAPDILVINLGINDIRLAGTSFVTLKAHIQTLIDNARAVNPNVIIILVVPTPINVYNTTTDNWNPSTLLQCYQDLLAANPGAYLVDTPLEIYNAGLGTLNPGSTVGTRVNTYTNLDGLGYMPNHDNLHAGKEIYQAEGYAIAKVIKTALGL